MISHVLNLFAIDNLAKLRRPYRLLEVTNLPKNIHYPENLQRLAGMVAKETRKPVSVYRNRQRTYLATTATEDLKPEWRLTPHVAVLVPDPNEYYLDYSAIAPEQVEVALNLLRYELRTALMKAADLWNDTPGSFYLRRPMNHGAESQVDVLEGFVFRLHYLPDDGIYISLDPTVRYVDRRSLLERLNSGEAFEDFRFQHFLYRFGHRWYRVQVMGMTDNSIATQLFYHEKHGKTYNVYEYTQESCEHPRPEYVDQLDPNSPAILYRYPNSSRQFYGAATLCFRTYKTDDPRVHDLHPFSILEPGHRLQKSKELVCRYLQNVRIDPGVQLAISDQPLTRSPDRFEVPDLLFGGGKVLHVRLNGEDAGVPLQDLGKKRMELILNSRGGLLAQGTLRVQYIFSPMSLHRSVSEGFQREFIKQMERLLSHQYAISTILYDDRLAKNLRQQVDAIKRAVEKNHIDRGCALLILPETANPDLHNFIKRELSDILQFQCVNATSLIQYFRPTVSGYVLRDDNRGKFISYTRYTALGMLLVNHRWPFALNEPLHYELYIGIDVLNLMAGFTYVYNAGKDCYFRHCRSKQSEKLSGKQIQSVLYRDLQTDINQLGLQPRSIVIHRDGRSYAQEEDGAVKAIRNLQQDGFLPADIEFGIVEVHKKSSARLRLNRQQDSAISNPRVGDYFVIDKRQGIVCNTGWPFHFPGTVNPLHVSIAYGNLDIKKVLADVFALAQLAWSAPDKPSRLPITIKLGDMFLEPIASEFDEEAAWYGEDELSEEVMAEEVNANEFSGGETP